MTLTARTQQMRIPTPWLVAAGVSATLVSVELLTRGSSWYAWALVVAVATTGGLIARVDARTMKLPNRLTTPLTIAALGQVVFLAAARSSLSLVLNSLMPAVVLFAIYGALGLAGWFGLGDAKFVLGLGLSAALVCGMTAVFIAPAAITLSGIGRLALGATSGRGPHGPALVVATVGVIAVVVGVRS